MKHLNRLGRVLHLFAILRWDFFKKYFTSPKQGLGALYNDVLSYKILLQFVNVIKQETTQYKIKRKKKKKKQNVTRNKL